ncbi:MAG: hypothetical protein Q8S00_24495 [Deltaproteobacteria bacterium]|nr:hypothetical protein [Deltaproteobacteria bacterium]
MAHRGGAGREKKSLFRENHRLQEFDFIETQFTILMDFDFFPMTAEGAESIVMRRGSSLNPLRTLYYYSSKFARRAQMIWKLKAVGVGNSSRQGAKHVLSNVEGSPSSEGIDKNSYE